MNERIKQLEKQAFVKGHWSDDGERFIQSHTDMAKFADLLVKECANFVQFYYKDHACEGIAHDMKKHFGVE